MKLLEYYGKEVKITATNGQSFTGVISDYIYPEDNEPAEESVVMDAIGGRVIEFPASDIKRIDVIKM